MTLSPRLMPPIDRAVAASNGPAYLDGQGLSTDRELGAAAIETDERLMDPADDPLSGNAGYAGFGSRDLAAELGIKSVSN
jgi:hypothetical protein